jgi:hypothetical protein
VRSSALQKAHEAFHAVLYEVCEASKTGESFNLFIKAVLIFNLFRIILKAATNKKSLIFQAGL